MEEEKITEEFNEEEVEIDEEGTETDTEDNTSDDDVEFDYDEDGNVIIPEDSEEEKAEEEKAEETSEDTSTEDEKESDSDDSNASAVVPDEKDTEIADLRKQIAERDSIIRDALKSLGVNEDEGIEGLEKLAAEAEEKTLEEYRNERNKKNQQEEAVRIVKRQKFEEKIRADLEAVQLAYPSAKQYKSVFEFPNFDKFSKFRDAGLTPEEAYIAANSKSVMTSVADAAQQQARNLSSTKDHLRSNVPVGSKDTSVTLTKRQMEEFKSLFPNMSNKEIVELYKKTNRRN